MSHRVRFLHGQRALDHPILVNDKVGGVGCDERVFGTGVEHHTSNEGITEHWVNRSPTGYFKEAQSPCDSRRALEVIMKSVKPVRSAKMLSCFAWISILALSSF